MNKKLLGFAGILTFALFGCGDEGTSTADTFGSVTNFVPLELDYVELPSCAGNTWSYYAETAGWTNGANLVNAWDSANEGGWNEEHTLLSVGFEEDGSRDYLQTDLEAGTSVASFQQDVNTVFACGVHDVDPVMTYVIRVYDLDGNMAECGAFATDPAGAGSVLSGAADTLNPITAPGEVSEANCLEWTVSR